MSFSLDAALIAMARKPKGLGENSTCTTKRLLLQINDNGRTDGCQLKSGEPMDLEASVIEFHHKMKLPIKLQVEWPEKSRTGLRMDLIAEEYQELLEAVANEDIVETADALVDLVYVAIGMCVELGIPFNRVFNEVHQSNLRKVDGPKSPEGKQLKPEGWVPPNVKQILMNRGYRDEPRD